jgi:anti-sigma factor RsiW
MAGVAPEELAALADGELSRARRATVEAAVAASPETGAPARGAGPRRGDDQERERSRARTGSPAPVNPSDAPDP